MVEFKLLLKFKVPFETLLTVIIDGKLKKNVCFKKRLFKLMFVEFKIFSIFESELQRLLEQMPYKYV
jgi:hypothetical protein